ncbi:hypothetical protein Hanom_Chr03g00235271 [Helianthus anomalus]
MFQVTSAVDGSSKVISGCLNFGDDDDNGLKMNDGLIVSLPFCENCHSFLDLGLGLFF